MKRVWQTIKVFPFSLIFVGLEVSWSIAHATLPLSNDKVLRDLGADPLTAFFISKSVGTVK